MISYRLRGLVNLHAAITTAVAGAFFLTYASSVRFIPFIDVSRDVNLSVYLLCVVAGMIASIRVLNTYGPRFHRITWVDAARIATRQVICIALFIFALMFALKDRSLSRLFVGSYLCLCWALLLFFNQGLPRMLSRIAFQRTHKLPTLFIGSSTQRARLRTWLAKNEALGIQPVGFLSETAEDGRIEGESPFLGSTKSLRDVVQAKSVAQVILLELPETLTQTREIIETCQDSGCRVLIYNNLGDQLQHPLIPISEEGHHFYTLQEEPLEDPSNRILKRIYDIAVSLPVVLFILPILCVWVWIVQRLQAPGRVFFTQARIGQRGRQFSIYKFRSMYDANYDAKVEARQATKGDKRIYSFGGFLRRTSLDEFPQFINVLKGEMSIVGPRPHLAVHDEEFARLTKAYRTRFFVKPGITGLAQTKGYRGEIVDQQLLHKRIHFDLQYITSWSVWLDIQITIKTLGQVIFSPPSAH
ncbi:MAG TPA: exopolysaccharide biosynthesis polyprenyl glycosylphosphotransferase [Opitutaceae bacterium]|jgi:exopolysaccharide biosynthesis polyprenyl glycosylphosphotransferase|nr:exopolysaccharide biosynthesis polyprenyl glycosylphosphotransferase [Opitutaceae bacterium]